VSTRKISSSFERIAKVDLEEDKLIEDDNLPLLEEPDKN
jgi:hypothetical protein